MKKKYLKPRTSSFDVAENLCIISASMVGGNEDCPGDPIMGTDGMNTNYWDL